MRFLVTPYGSIQFPLRNTFVVHAETALYLQSHAQSVHLSQTKAPWSEKIPQMPQGTSDQLSHSNCRIALWETLVLKECLCID